MRRDSTVSRDGAIGEGSPMNNSYKRPMCPKCKVKMQLRAHGQASGGSGVYGTDLWVCVLCHGREIVCLNQHYHVLKGIDFANPLRRG